MKRRGFVALFLIICLSLVFVSCSSEVQNGNGQVVSLSFEGPGVLAYVSTGKLEPLNNGK